MSPFQEFQLKAKEVREDYSNRIANNPEQKDALEKELKEVLARLLDDCEKKELEATKHV